MPASDVPAFYFRKVYNFDDLKIDGLPRGAAEYFFNPAIYRTQSGTTQFLARYVGDGRRELFCLPLDRDLNFVGKTAASFSGALRKFLPQVTWFADPRHFTFRGKDYITFNNGQNPLPNDIYLAEVDWAGLPVKVYTLAKEDGRQPIEKNWGFFESEGHLYCVYSIQPFTVLACEFHGDRVLCRTVYENHWASRDYEDRYGDLHGGPSPIKIGEDFHFIVQSRFPKDHDRVYYASILSFESTAPFRPKAFSYQPLMPLTPDELKIQPAQTLNKFLRSCIYPGGFFWDESAQGLVMSYGINDFASGVRCYAQDALLPRLTPIKSIERRHVTPALTAGQDTTDTQTRGMMRTFFWNARKALKNPFRYGNVGDQLEEHLISRIYKAAPIHDDTRGARLLGVGSISHRMLAGDTLWGTGFRNQPPAITAADAATIDVRATRGPLTLEYLKKYGVDVSKVTHFFDPGLLIGDIFGEELAAVRAQAEASGKIGSHSLAFVPHHHDRAAFRAAYGALGVPIIDVDASLLDFCAALLSANLIVASSLHGIILAEALGVPAVMHKPMMGEQIEKFFDYYYGTDRMTFPVVESFEHLISVEPPELPKLNIPAWLATRPSPEDLAARNILISA